MLVLNLKTAKDSEHLSLSACYLNDDTSCSQWHHYYKIIRNYQQTCMWSQKIIKAETTLESLELIH